MFNMGRRRFKRDYGVLGGSGGGGSFSSLDADNIFIADYNDTSSQNTPIPVTNGDWADIPNDGLGSFTQEGYLPDGFDLLDSGALSITDFDLGGAIFVRNDLIFTPNINGSRAEFRYKLGAGPDTYYQQKALGPLFEGANTPVEFGAEADYIYVGDENTRQNPIVLQARIIGGGGTIVNRGIALFSFNPTS